MSEFHKLLARLKTALESAPEAEPHVAMPDSAAPLPVASTAHRAELLTTFVREFEAVSGRFLGTFSPKEAASRVAALARETQAHTAAVGEGVTADMGAFASALEQDGGCAVERSAEVDDGRRLAAVERLARCDLAVAEADYAIASTGTFAVLGAPARPHSLTLLPPTSVIVVRIDRMVATLAEAVAALGNELTNGHRLSLITGPSRTADIEKRIVLGVHGPKALYGAVIWPRDE